MSVESNQNFETKSDEKPPIEENKSMATSHSLTGDVNIGNMVHQIVSNATSSGKTTIKIQIKITKE